jgi:hypothetical protein
MVAEMGGGKRRVLAAGNHAGTHCVAGLEGPTEGCGKEKISSTHQGSNTKP